MKTIRVHLPYHLRLLARDLSTQSPDVSSDPVAREVSIEVEEPITIARVIGALESRYPSLRGTIRDQQTGSRRAFVRFFVSGADWSNQSLDTPLPDAIASGDEPLMVIGALAGG